MGQAARPLKEIDAAGDDDFGMVIVFNSSAEILQSSPATATCSGTAIRAIQPTQRPTRIEEALTLADSLANPSRIHRQRSGRPADEEPGKERTYVPTEGIADRSPSFLRWPIPRRAPTSRLGNLRPALPHGTARPGRKTWITSALLLQRRARRHRPDQAAGVRAGTRNYRPTAVGNVQVELEYEGRRQGGSTAGQEGRVCRPGRSRKSRRPARTARTVSDKPGEGTASLSNWQDLDDRADFVHSRQAAGRARQFPLDDEAWLVVGVVRKAKVLIVGPVNASSTRSSTTKPPGHVAEVDHADARTS